MSQLTGPRRPRGTRAQVTLDDVARRAGVSTASVSRAINQPQMVRSELRHAVLEVVAELGYVPNGFARALASRRSHTIGAIVPTLGAAIFASGIQALQSRLQPHGYHLLVAADDYDPKKERDQARAMVERGVDALVLVGQAHLPETRALLERRRLPHVDTYNFVPGGSGPCIGFDNRAAAWLATEHLIGQGHRRFGIATIPCQSNDRIRARLAGMLACLAAHGIALPPDQVVEVPYALAGGREALARLLALGRGITALPCVNDLLAYGALAECASRGLAVPGDLSVTGIDDLEIAAHTRPPLTTIHVPTGALGAAVGDYLLGRLRGRAMPERTELPVELMQRASTGRPREAGRLG
jgi:LacI family transcriptional regulator